MKSLDEKKAILGREANFVKGFLHGAKMEQSMKAYNLMVSYHKGVVRKNGLDYTTHPIRVAHQLLAAGVTDDVAIASALLHDVFEDCDIIPSDLFDVSNDVWFIIERLTKRPTKSVEDYYGDICGDARAMLVKMADRLHNLSTMHGAFTPEKMAEYVNETYEYVLPMCRRLKYEHPEYASVSYLFKNQIETICEIYESLLNPPTQVGVCVECYTILTDKDAISKLYSDDNLHSIVCECPHCGHPNGPFTVEGKENVQ